MISTFTNKGVKQALRQFSAVPAYVTTAPVTEISKLANGVRVASEGSDGELATINVWVNSGSRNENAKNHGASHFLQHLAFKGKDIESLGGQFTARACREKTVYSARVFKDDVPKAVQILAAAAQQVADEAVVTKEKDAVLRETCAHAVQLDKVVLDELHAAAFQGTSLARSTVGADENIRNLTRADLQQFVDANHTADRVVVSASGAVDHKQLLELTEKHFGGLKAGSAHAEHIVFTGSDKRIRYDSMKTAHVAVAFQTAGATSKYFFPLKLMETLIGSWERTSAAGTNAGSQYAIDVNDHELSSAYKTFNFNYKETGLFGVAFAAPDNKLDDGMWYTLKHLVRLCHEVSAQEVTTAKVQLKANWLRENGAENLGSQLLSFGRVISQAEAFARIDALTVDDVTETADKFINDEDHALAAIGPIYELPDYNWIRRRSFWHRY